MPPLLSLTLALLALATAGGIVAWWWSSKRPPRTAALPDAQSLSARPVFSADERRMYRQLREALPQHIVLAKLPLVRFSQPTDQGRVRYWYELLGSIDVTFAICSANGRVLAAVDLDNERSGSPQVRQIKQAVLGACGVRYLRCPLDRLPSIPELQLLVPQHPAAAPPPRTTAPGHDWAGDRSLAPAAQRQARRPAPWQDSGLFQDSFFAADSSADGQSEFPAIGRILRDGTGSARPSARGADGAPRSDAAKTPPDGAG